MMMKKKKKNMHALHREKQSVIVSSHLMLWMRRCCFTFVVIEENGEVKRPHSPDSLIGVMMPRGFLRISLLLRRRPPLLGFDCFFGRCCTWLEESVAGGNSVVAEEYASAVRAALPP